MIEQPWNGKMPCVFIPHMSEPSMIVDALKATPLLRAGGSVQGVFVNTNNAQLDRNPIDKKTGLP